MTDQPTERQRYDSIQTGLAAACFSALLTGALTALFGWIAVSIPLIFCALVFAVILVVHRLCQKSEGK